MDHIVPADLDSLENIDTAIDAFGQSVSLTKGMTHLPPELALNVAVILRALKVYRIVVGVSEDLKKDKGDD